jgi:hypothetical protein
MIKVFITIFISLICLVSCNQPEKVTGKIVTSSIAQRQIQYLVDTFKIEVGQEKDSDKQDSIRIKYEYKFYDLLSNIYIDSVRVHVDSVIVDSLTVTTTFHCNNEIAFKYSLTFFKKMDPRQDTVFRFMKGLTPGLDTMVNFAYMGSHQVRLPNSDGTPIIRIFAFPMPVWLPKKE